MSGYGFLLFVVWVAAIVGVAYTGGTLPAVLALVASIAAYIDGGRPV